MKVKRIPLNENFINYRIAHRGLHSENIAENSLSAFKAAIDKNYAIEIDVHLTTDGELAVVHDSNLKRVTGADVAVETLSSAELEKYPLLTGGEKIPLFRDVLALVDGKVPLLIELKFENNVFDYRQADALLKQLEDYKYKDMIALQSFQPFAVKYLKEHTGEYAAGYLCSYRLGNLSKFKTYILRSLKLYGYMHADFISYDIDFLPNKYVTKKRKKGVQVLAWTINTRDKAEKAKTVADNFIFENVNPEI